MSEWNMPFEPSKRKQMQMLRDEGLKCREIAERFGVTPQYVSQVCADYNPARFRYVDEYCVYPNLKKWMNDNKISRNELLRRMGVTVHSNNSGRLSTYMRGQCDPRKDFIDRMLKATGMTYEKLFYREDK